MNLTVSFQAWQPATHEQLVAALEAGAVATSVEGMQLIHAFKTTVRTCYRAGVIRQLINWFRTQHLDITSPNRLRVFFQGRNLTWYMGILEADWTLLRHPWTRYSHRGRRWGTCALNLDRDDFCDLILQNSPLVGPHGWCAPFDWGKSLVLSRLAVPYLVTSVEDVSLVI